MASRKDKKLFTPEEKEAILRAYEALTDVNQSQKIAVIGKQFDRSTDAVRRIVKAGQNKTEEKMFDYKQEMFI